MWLRCGPLGEHLGQDPTPAEVFGCDSWCLPSPHTSQLMTTDSKKKKIKFVGELSHVCSQIVLKWLYLARSGRPDILWSINKLARSITKWTKACDKRLNWLISYHSYEWIQTILSCGKYCWALLIGTVSGLWLRGRSGRFEIHFRRNIMRFWKSYICSNKLDETNISSHNSKESGSWWIYMTAYAEFSKKTKMKTILQEKQRIHYSTTIWFTSLFLCTKLWKFQQHKQQWTRNGKFGKNLALNLTKVWSKSEVIDEGRTSSAKVHFASSMDICHLKNAELEAKAPRIQRSSCTPWGCCKRRFWILRSIHWTRTFSILNESWQDYGYHLQIAWLRWTSSRRSISVYPSESGRCSQIIEISKIGVSRHLDSSTTTQMAKIMVHYGRRSRSSYKEFVRSSFGRTNVGKAIWENPIETWLGEHSKLGMSLCSSWKRIILISVCGWHKIGWKETKSWSDVETTQQRSRLGRTNIFLGSCILGLRNKQRYCGQLQNHVWIANFRGWSREITIPSKSSYFFKVLWHGWSCKEVCGTILWVGKQDDSITLQSIYSMHRWPPLQRRRKRIVKCMLSNCSEMLILGKNWTTRYFMVSK